MNCNRCVTRSFLCMRHPELLVGTPYNEELRNKLIKWADKLSPEELDIIRGGGEFFIDSAMRDALDDFTQEFKEYGITCEDCGRIRRDMYFEDAEDD